MKNFETLTGTTVTGNQNTALLFGYLGTAKRANLDNVTLRGTVTAGSGYYTSIWFYSHRY